MKSEYLHLFLGLTRSELKRRLELGQLDFHSIENQITEQSYETKLQAFCDQWLDSHKQDEQVDKYAAALDHDKDQDLK